MDLWGVQYVLVIFCLPSVTWAAYNTAGVVLPHDPYIYIGNNLTLTCNLTKLDITYDSRYLHFSRLNDEVIPPQYVTITNTRSIVLRYPVTGPDDGANYICKLNRTNSRPEIIGNQFVSVEYEPRPVTEIDCRVYNWENMTCTWDLGVEFVHYNTIDIQLVWATLNSQYDCPHLTRTSCSWWSIDGEDVFVEDLEYRMGVVIINSATKPRPTQYPAQIRVITVDSAKIVEPAPVSNLSAVWNSSCIHLTWSHEKWRREKVYQVMFRALGDHSWQTKHVGDVQTLTLCGLQANTKYEFNVSCKPRLHNKKVHGFWSRGAYISVMTNEDVPTTAPEFSAGSYVETPCQQYCRKVKLYWKSLSMANSNGNITSYRIDYLNLAEKGHWESTSSPKTQFTLMLVPTDSYKIQLRAATRRGVSRVYSEIYLPATSQKPEVPEHMVEVHNRSQSATISLSWEPARVTSSIYWSNITSYTVYWCRGSKLDRSCQEPIHSADIDVNSDPKYELSVDQFDTYMFGVAVNAMTRSGQVISSGFKWNTCTYIQNTKPEVAPGNVQFSKYQPNAGISIEWDKLTCHQTHAYITHYIISVCPSKQGDNCTGDISTYPAARTDTSFTLGDLEEDSRYKIWINAISMAGMGPKSDTLFDVVVDKSLTTGEIGGIVVGSLFVLIIFLFGIILCSRRIFRTVKKKYFVPVAIEIPHTLPPLPPIPMPRQLSTDSDSSEGIYEKIDGPPSPCSSTESTTGVEAPLIHNKWKLSTLKNQLYGRRKEQRHSHDSGRGSLSQSADTLLMRLHPAHLKKHKKSKKTTNRSESDSGVIVDGRGQVCSYTSRYTTPSEQSHYTKGGCESEGNYNVEYSNEVDPALRSGEVNPYSCVDIVDKINCTSEKLKRKESPKMFMDDSGTCVNMEDINKGSTMSLPPGVCKISPFLSHTLDNRAQSAGNELGIDDRRLSSMKEGKEFESSDIYSEDGTLDSVGDNEHETSESGGSGEPSVSSANSEESQEPVITSYIRFVNNDTTVELCDDVFEKDMSSLVAIECDCCCHGNKSMPVAIGDGYVGQNMIVGHSEENCGCEMIKLKPNQNYEEEVLKHKLMQDFQHGALMHGRSHGLEHGHLQVGQMYNVPPHFFGSMSKVPGDPATITEL